MDDEPMWAADHVVAPTHGFTIAILETANEFAIKGNHLTLVSGNQFDGRTKTDPHKHIHEFLRIFNMFKYRDTENEAICLMMFPLSLTGEAKTWLNLLEEEIFAEFDEFMAMTVDENSDSESNTEEPTFEKITINTNYKIKTSLEEPPTDLKIKPLPDNLEYVFMEEPSFLPVIISSQLSKEKKNKLVSVFKKHKQAFAWKTTDIPGIFLSLCKHKIQLLDDKKPVVQKQRMLNPNMQEVVMKEIMKLLDTGIIYPIIDSRWGCSSCPKLEKMSLNGQGRNCAWTQALRHLFKKQDAKSRLIRWILLLQEFDIEIKDRKGTENVATNHLSRIENDELSDDSEVDDNFPGETLMEIYTKDEPWFADFANYLVGDVIPKGMTYQQKNNFFFNLKHYF
nr:reverse transcriptase domain-containing protein [Tanacetum cinerariifolium]